MPSRRRGFRRRMRHCRKAIGDFFRATILSSVPSSTSEAPPIQTNLGNKKSESFEDTHLLSEQSSLRSETNSLAEERTSADFNNNDIDVSEETTRILNIIPAPKNIEYFTKQKLLRNNADLDLPCLKDLPLFYKTLFKADGVIEGMMSRVYRVTSGTGKSVVKVMGKDLVNHGGSVHSKLNGHKNIPDLYGETYMGGDYYGLVQEYAAGKTLEMMLMDGDLDKLTLSEKLDLACQLCDAVDHCHKHNIIHQNIHPGHIIVNPKTLNVTLVPTSTAALIGDAGRFRGIGEIRYLSPESVLDSRAITCREDVWSLGMVLAEIFTGFRPYLNHADLFSASDYAVFHENNRELPRFRQARAGNVEWRVFKGKGPILEQVGVLVNLATCSTPDLRPSAYELFRNFKMLYLQCKEC